MASLASRVVAANLKAYSALCWRHYYPINYQRYMFSTLAPRLSPTPEGVSRRDETVDGIPAAWLIPDGADDDRVILYLHGGAFVIGSIESHWKMVARIARAAGCRALLPDYRLAPENPYPAAFEDCLAAYRWLLAQGYPSEKIVIAGDSAGGSLTACVLLSLRDSGEPMPAAGVMLSPATDLKMTSDSFRTRAKEDPLIRESWGGKCIGMYLAGTDPTDPAVSALYADLQGLPPILIQVGTREILLDDSRRFTDRALQQGVDVDLQVWEGMFHVWQFHCGFMPESGEAVRSIGEYCRQKASIPTPEG